MNDSTAHVDRADGLFRAYQNASRSEEGDRAHAEASFNFAKEQLKALLDFKKEVEADRVSYVITTDREFYYAKFSVPLPGVLIIGEKSPLGQAILNKKPGDKYTLLASSGEIKSID